MHSVIYLNSCLINVTHIIRSSDLLEHEDFMNMMTMYIIQKANNTGVDKTMGE